MQEGADILREQDVSFQRATHSRPRILIAQTGLAFRENKSYEGLTDAWRFAKLHRMKKTGAERLAEYRDRHGYKQYELAELLGVTEAYLSQLLAHKRRPGLPTAVRFEELTGIPAASWLLSPRSKRVKAVKPDLVPVQLS